MMTAILLQQQQHAPRTEALREEAITRALRQSSKKRGTRRRRLGRFLRTPHTPGSLPSSPPGAGGRLLQL
jgi:hypothetical protein